MSIEKIKAHPGTFGEFVGSVRVQSPHHEKAGKPLRELEIAVCVSPEGPSSLCPGNGPYVNLWALRDGEVFLDNQPPALDTRQVPDLIALLEAACKKYG